MADGEVRIKVTVDGKDVESTITGLDNLQQSSKQAAGGIKDIATSLGLVKVASKAIEVLSSSLNEAIGRFDTIERYPKVMESLGYGADVSTESIEKLSKGIEGLPTKLDSVVSSTQRMTTITGQLGKSTDAVIALNNSFMANGASVSDAERGMVQYLQMLSKGTVDIVSWRTLQETMGVALRKTAEAMGYLGSNGVNQLYSALQSGKTTFSEFQNNLISIATGTGEIATLAQQNSQGIATSFTNLKTAVVRNLADLVKVFDTLSKEITGKTIAENINSMKDGINASFKSINSTVKKATPVFKTFAEVVKATISVVKKLEPVLVGVATAYVALKVIQSVSGMIKKSNSLIETARKSTQGLSMAVDLHSAAKLKETAAEGANVAAKKASIATQAAQNGTIGLGTAAIGLLTGALTVHEVATMAATAATEAFSVALGVIASPLGIVIGAIGLFAAGLAFHKSTTDKAVNSTDSLASATERLIQKTSEATKGIDENISARKTEIEDLDASTDAYNALADELDELIKSEHKSASEKSRIQTIVDSLNGSLNGLGLAYDKENDSISVGTGLLKDRIKVLQEKEKAQSAQKNIVQINEDIQKSEKALKTYNEEKIKLEKELGDQRETNAMLFARHDISMAESAKSYTKAIDELNTKISEEESRQASLKAQKEETDTAIIASQAAVDEAVQNGVMSQTMSYELLSDSQKEAVDSMTTKWQEYCEQTTNMFDALEQDSALSVDQLIANLSANQLAMDQWGTNMETLRTRLSQLGLSDALVSQFEEMGPQYGLTLAGLVQESDGKLAELAGAFDQGSKTATNVLKKNFDFEGSGINEQITNLVTQTKEGLKGQMEAADFSSITANVGTDLATGIGQNAEAVLSSSQELGSNVPKGAATGIHSNLILVEDAVTRLAKATSTGFATPLGIQSPSTVFAGYGKNIIEGLKNGISSTKETALSEMRTLAFELPRLFDGLQSQFYQIGAYLMEGLANGIRANADTAVAEAQAAAGRVKAATQHAYDEHSPSKWMKDFVGKYLMYGLAEGLHKYTSVPVNAMLNSAEAIKVPMITAEMAIGSNFAGKRDYGHTVNYYNSANENETLIKAISKLSNRPIIVSTAVDGREIARTTAVPMDYEIQRNKKLKTMLNGGRP